MRHVWRAVAAAALLLTPGVTAAQKKPIAVSAKADFKHKHSKLRLPAILHGLGRVGVTEYETDQLDVATEYQSPDGGEVYTVYIYRHVAGSLPVWFDRAEATIRERGLFGTPGARSTGGAFIPPGQSVASGLTRTYDLDEGLPFRSTGVALAPLGEWLVKIRASSKTKNRGELAAHLKAAFMALKWPKRMDAVDSAYEVASCTTQLDLSGDASPAPKTEESGASLLLSALAGSLAEETRETVASPAARWCRDEARMDMGGVYRANESRDSYLIAVGDAGRAVRVEPSLGNVLLAAEGADAAKRNWSVALLLLGELRNAPEMDRLPPPAQAMRIVEMRPLRVLRANLGQGQGEYQRRPECLRMRRWMGQGLGWGVVAGLWLAAGTAAAAPQPVSASDKALLQRALERGNLIYA